jgi:putative methyltransferase (TIGR04325 family)
LNLINLIFRLCGKIFFSSEKKDWSTALNLSKSYQDKIIFETLIKTLNNIKDKNKEFYERDTCILKNKPNERHLIKFLQKKILTNNNREVLDYGGSLGSRFFSNYNFIKNNKIKWNIIEQKNLVQYGKNFLENNFLSFYNNLDECISEKKIDCVIFSNSLQYIDDYLKILKQIKDTDIKYIFFDEFPLSNSKKHRIFVQNIHKKIYDCSYPIRIFSKNLFLDEVKKLNFSVSNLCKKRTVFYGFSYTTLVLKNLNTN